jgi:hypothetical protein
LLILMVGVVIGVGKLLCHRGNRENALLQYITYIHCRALYEVRTGVKGAHNPPKGAQNLRW